MVTSRCKGEGLLAIHLTFSYKNGVVAPRLGLITQVFLVDLTLKAYVVQIGSSWTSITVSGLVSI